MSISETAIVCLFSASVIANIVHSVFNRRLAAHMNRWDLFRWVSSYRLFSVKPRVFKLLYRDRTIDHTTQWEEVPVVPVRKWHHPFFFPEMLVYTSIYSQMDDLIRFAEEGHDTEVIRRSFTYRTIVKYVAREPLFESTVARQFRIDETGGNLAVQDTRQGFISDFESECISR